MPEDPKPAKPTESETASDRYRFIGFEVFGKPTHPFWKSDAEAQQYAGRLHTGMGESVLYRESSLLEEEAMSTADRWVVGVAAAIMLLTVAMPWVGYRTSAGTDFSLWWPSALGTLLGGLGTAFGSGIAVGLSALLGLVVMVGGPILGAWALVMVLRKPKSQDAYLMGLRLPLKLGYVIFFSGLAVFLLSLVGGYIDGFASWGLINPPEKYNTGVLFSILSYGAYLAVAGGMVCAVKSGDL